MTAIAAIIDKKNKRTYLASDSMGSNEHTGHNYKDTKLFKNNHISIAGCGSYRGIQILKYHFSPRAFQVSETIENYVYRYLVDEIRNTFKNNGLLKKDNDVESVTNVRFILAIGDRIFNLQNDLSIIEPENMFCASGSGEYHVESSIYTQLKLGQTDYKKILKDSIKITSEIVLSVGGKIHLIEHKH